MTGLPEYFRDLGDQLPDRLGCSLDSVYSVHRHYVEKNIPKKSGGFRSISIPSADLLSLQRKLNRSVLRFLPKSKHAMGFVSGRSIAMHAAVHASRQCVIRLDIKDFFPSTAMERVGEKLRGFCWAEDSIEALLHICGHPEKKGLPQGAATSPALSNIVNAHLDNQLAQVARAFGSRYSRYVDDLTFSSTRRFHRRSSHVAKLIAIVTRILDRYGYVLNSKKTRVMGPGTRQVVTGLVVNEQAQLPRVVRRRIRAAEYRRTRGQHLENITGKRRGEPMAVAQLRGWQALQSMTVAVNRNVKTAWGDVLAGSLENRLSHAEYLSAAISRLEGGSWAPGKALTRFLVAQNEDSCQQEVAARVLFDLCDRNVVGAHFTEAAKALDEDLRSWRTRPLSHVAGVVLHVVENFVFSLGCSDSNTCSLIADNLARASKSLDLEQYIDSLYDRGLRSEVWVSSDSNVAINAWCRSWLKRHDGDGFVAFVSRRNLARYVEMPDNFKFLELGVNALAEEKSAAAQRVIFAKMMLEDLRAQRLAAQGSNGVGG